MGNLIYKAWMTLRNWMTLITAIPKTWKNKMANVTSLQMLKIT